MSDHSEKFCGPAEFTESAHWVCGSTPIRSDQPEIPEWTRFHYPYFRTGFWVRGGSRAFARISSRTLGRYVVVTNPAPPRCRSNGFQRISGALQTTPEEPRQRNGPLGAPKRRPDPPQPAPHPPRLVCGGNHGAGTHWCPSGGAPRWRRPGRRRPEPSPGVSGNTQGPSFAPCPGPTAPAARNFRLCLPSYEK